nr:hypothetical protein CFP56_10973 [Quercus suber]
MTFISAYEGGSVYMRSIQQTHTCKSLMSMLRFHHDRVTVAALLTASCFTLHNQDPLCEAHTSATVEEFHDLLLRPMSPSITTCEIRVDKIPHVTLEPTSKFIRVQTRAELDELDGCCQCGQVGACTWLGD